MVGPDPTIQLFQLDGRLKGGHDIKNTYQKVPKTEDGCRPPEILARS